LLQSRKKHVAKASFANYAFCVPFFLSALAIGADRRLNANSLRSEGSMEDHCFLPSKHGILVAAKT